jgi:AraC family transcriptional regulator
MTTTNEPVSGGAVAYDRVLRDAGGRLVGSAHGADGAQLRVTLYEATPYDLKVAPMPVPRLSINLRAAAVHGGLCGERERGYAGRRYSLFLTPARADAHWRKDAPSSHLNLYFSERTLEEVTDGARGLIGIDRPLMDAHRPGLKVWIDALEAALALRDPLAADAALSLARIILATLARHPGKPVPTLARSTLIHVHEYLAAHLDRPIRVADLAAVAGMTPCRFTLALQSASGRTPHRLVLEQRIARATDLLCSSRLALADVAAACGFSSQAHLTTTMRRVAGITPGRLRRAEG